MMETTQRVIALSFLILLASVALILPTGEAQSSIHIITSLGDSPVKFAVDEETVVAYGMWDIYLYSDEPNSTYTIRYTENSSIIDQGNFTYHKKISYEVHIIEYRITIKLNNIEMKVDTVVANYQLYVTDREQEERIPMLITKREFQYEIYKASAWTVIVVITMAAPTYTKKYKDKQDEIRRLV
jgi:hypothetical protein